MSRRQDVDGVVVLYRRLHEQKQLAPAREMLKAPHGYPLRLQIPILRLLRNVALFQSHLPFVINGTLLDCHKEVLKTPADLHTPKETDHNTWPSRHSRLRNEEVLLDVDQG